MKKAILLALLLSGCVTNQEQQITADDTRCQSYGVPKGSPAYVECRMKLDQGRSDRQASERFARGGGLIGAIRAAND